jgi:COMPASS component BRE2
MSKQSSPAREVTPSIPQKRPIEDDHLPSVSSPLNPDVAKFAKDDAPLTKERAARVKKESVKKRESKGGSVAPEHNTRGTPDPKAKAASKQKPVTGTTTPSQQHVLAPQRYVLPQPKPSEFEPARAATLIPARTFNGINESEIQFYTITDHVHNKKDFRYTYCIADPAFKATQYYRQTEAEPFGARLSFEDAAKDVCLDADGRFATTDKGWRMARANVAVRSGRYYWECKVHKGVDNRTPEEVQATGKHTGPAVRLGWARREAPLDMSVGFNAYSYGLRDVAGQKVHLSRPLDYFPDGEEVQVGDVVGIEIRLPSESLHRKIVEGNYNPAVDLDDDEDPEGGRAAAPIIRDRVPITYKGQLYFEHIEYQADKSLQEFITNPTPFISSTGGGVIGAAKLDMHPTHPSPALRTLPGSYIKFYKNGRDMGVAFRDLLAFFPPASRLPENLGERSALDDGTLGYYPAVSVLRDSVVEVNLGPEFWFPPPDYEVDGHEEDEVDMVGSKEQTPVSKMQKEERKKLRAVSERFDEGIAEDVVYDLVDEVCAFMENGGIGGFGVNGDVGIGGMAVEEEVKELVQDED